MKIMDIFYRLNELSDEDIVFLNYEDCFQLLIGVILSAQSTDNRVNTVLPKLFDEYPTPKELSTAEKDRIAEIIHSVGLYNTKAENIIKTANIIHQSYNDRIPSKMEDLLQLNGVGRKSANVIRGACFNLPAIIVDTHFKRVVLRLGLTEEKHPELIEKDLREKIPFKIQYRFSMLINKHGRTFCKAKNPLCSECPLLDICLFYKISSK